MSSTDTAAANLDRYLALLREGREVATTGRQLLRVFGAERRGRRVVSRIRNELAKRNLATEPDFYDVWVDDPIRVVLTRDSPVGDVSPPGSPTEHPASTSPADEPRL
jgi:hypothetical protein